MPETIEVGDTRLTPLPTDQLTPAMRRPGLSWYDLTITVRNPATDGPLHVMDEIRQLRYDAGRKALLVDLSENDEPAGPATLERPEPPTYRRIGPGAEVTLTHRLASPITIRTGTAGPTTVRIPEDVDSVECTIAYDTTAPPTAPGLAAADRSRPRHRWGRAVRTSCAPQ